MDNKLNNTEGSENGFSQYTYTPPEHFFSPPKKNGFDKELASLLIMCGLVPILYIGISYACSFVALLTHRLAYAFLAGTGGIFYFKHVFYPALELVFSLVCLIVPFLVLLALKKSYKREDKEIRFLSVRPVSLFDTLTYVSLGFVGVYAGSYMTSMTTAFFNGLGITLIERDYSIPEHPIGIFISFVTMALIAGIFEELLFRGAVLSYLRRYGDLFAVLVSAFLFAVLHRNLIQLPYTFALGVIMGLVAVKSENIIYSMIIHILNNTLAFASMLLEELGLESANAVFNAVYSIGVMALGALGILLYVVKFKKSCFAFNKGERDSLKRNPYVAAVLCPTIIVAFVVCAVQTLEYISFGG